MLHMHCVQKGKDEQMIFQPIYTAICMRTYLGSYIHNYVLECESVCAWAFTFFTYRPMALNAAP